MSLRLAGFAALWGVLSACSTAPPAPEVSPTDIAAQYRLGAGDQIRVTVFNQANLSGDFAVDESGFISMPLPGPVQSRRTHAP